MTAGRRRVLVVGATGVLGRQVVPRLVARGHIVRAVVRRIEDAEMLLGRGVEVTRGDLLDARSLQGVAWRCDVALHLATAVPRPGAPLDFTLNDRIRREGTVNLITECRARGVRRYVQQSIAFIYGDHGDEIVDERSEIRPPPLACSAADMERIVRESGLAWAILRGGSFYGPGTGREESLRREARAGTLRVPGDGSAWLSLVHVEDMATAVVAAAERDDPELLLNVVDDAPVRFRELYDHVARVAGAPPPPAGAPARLPSVRCSNARARAVLSWAPAHPTYRDAAW
ncbi:MAG TPA: NAD-dependent epimerase/dehydratase family protein [Gemmatimonadaceae bacterium]